MKFGRKNNNSKDFWNKEYKDSSHLALSNNPSEDLIKFARWLERAYGNEQLNHRNSVLDLGCGNGRNLIFLCSEYGLKGKGIDISKEAVEQAISQSNDLPIEYEVGSIANPLPVPDDSQMFVLDMMTSHFLNKEEREKLVKEIFRVLKPGGWLFFKTFLADEDAHVKRLIKENPASESGSYIHPKIGVAEHVFTETEVQELLSDMFTIEKITKSHGHLKNGQAHKRRSMSIYAQRNF